MNQTEQELKRIEEYIKDAQHVLDNQNMYHLDDITNAKKNHEHLSQRKSDISLGLEAGRKDFDVRLEEATKCSVHKEPQNFCHVCMEETIKEVFDKIENKSNLWDTDDIRGSSETKSGDKWLSMDIVKKLKFKLLGEKE